ncbi:hypothetical protein ABZ930_29410 [Streptomyces sp. NPDC046716]|uniref:hypothetical protein n=1 Tax=Streptomyces sp. NPDC046716 TaxID=3157093 RepID=UPI003405B419
MKAAMHEMTKAQWATLVEEWWGGYEGDLIPRGGWSSPLFPVYPVCPQCSRDGDCMALPVGEGRQEVRVVFFECGHVLAVGASD